ncbi:MAG: Uma2 family endonuclease [Ktedonobacteraceae bacterium]|nr:Uma2 family endonuclease [Ktedonobacteraceae bacterium]
MVAQPSRQTMSVDEWRELERASCDAKHEYIDGQVYLTAGGSRSHGRISSNTVRTLEDVLLGTPCNVYNSDVSVRLSKTRYTYPDVSVTCDERDQPTPDETEVQFPRVIVEVLSDSTEAYDRGRKFGYYRACLTIEEYVLVASKYQAVEVYTRTPQGWTVYHAYGLGDEIELVSIGVRFPLAALYKNAAVPEMTDASEGEV